MQKKPKQFRRMCIYCGEGNLSFEHIWSDWIEEVLPPEPWHRSRVFNQIIDPKTQEPHVGEPPTKRQEGSMQNRKKKIVCKRCNNGWMSKIDEAVKPILTKMIHASDFTFSPEDQAIVAAWVAKSTITNEYMMGTGPCTSERDRKHLMETMTCPPDWLVSVANYDGTEWDRIDSAKAINLVFQQDMGRMVPKVGDQRYPNVQTRVFAIGKVAFEVRCTSSEEWQFSPSDVQGRNNLFYIWPPYKKDIQWPPTAVGDDFLDWLELDVFRLLRQFGVDIEQPRTRLSERKRFDSGGYIHSM